jgi:hypothetical protein
MVDGPQHQSGSDDYHSDLGALDFSSPDTHDDTAGSLDTLQSLTEAEEEQELALYTVTNPSKSVSVSAMMDGRIHLVELTDKVERMTESQLAEEIFVLADLARQKGRAGQYEFLLDSLSDDPEATAALTGLVSLTLNLPTREEAEAAEEAVFADRYFSDKYGDDD